MVPSWSTNNSTYAMSSVNWFTTSTLAKNPSFLFVVAENNVTVVPTPTLTLAPVIPINPRLVSPVPTLLLLKVFFIILIS